MISLYVEQIAPNLIRNDYSYLIASPTVMSRYSHHRFQSLRIGYQSTQLDVYGRCADSTDNKFYAIEVYFSSGIAEVCRVTLSIFLGKLRIVPEMSSKGLQFAAKDARLKKPKITTVLLVKVFHTRKKNRKLLLKCENNTDMANNCETQKISIVFLHIVLFKLIELNEYCYNNICDILL